MEMLRARARSHQDSVTASYTEMLEGETAGGDGLATGVRRTTAR